MYSQVAQPPGGAGSGGGAVRGGAGAGMACPGVWRRDGGPGWGAGVPPIRATPVEIHETYPFRTAGLQGGHVTIHKGFLLLVIQIRAAFNKSDIVSREYSDFYCF